MAENPYAAMNQPCSLSVQFFGELGEEIVVQCPGYAQEQKEVDGLLVENLVDMGAGDTYLLCQPRRRPALLHHDMPYSVPYVHGLYMKSGLRLPFHS